jgi:hypothetical protein
MVWLDDGYALCTPLSVEDLNWKFRQYFAVLVFSGAANMHGRCRFLPVLGAKSASRRLCINSCQDRLEKSFRMDILYLFDIAL